jgi:hypothetical protein
VVFSRVNAREAMLRFDNIERSVSSVLEQSRASLRDWTIMNDPAQSLISVLFISRDYCLIASKSYSATQSAECFSLLDLNQADRFTAHKLQKAVRRILNNHETPR